MVVSNVTEPAAVTVRRFAVNTVEVWPSSVMAPAATRFTSFWLPAVTVVTAIAPPAFTSMAPLDVTTLRSEIVFVSSMSMAPVPPAVMVAVSTLVSSVTESAAVAVRAPAVMRVAGLPSSLINPLVVSVTLFEVFAVSVRTVKDPPASTVIEPLFVTTLVREMASVSSMSTLPAAVVVISAEPIVVSNVTEPAAVAVRRFAVNTVEVWPSSVMAPAATSFTSFWLPAVTVVTAIAPPAFTSMAPLDVTTLTSEMAFVSSMSTAPVAVV